MARRRRVFVPLLLLLFRLALLVSFVVCVLVSFLYDSVSISCSVKEYLSLPAVVGSPISTVPDLSNPSKAPSGSDQFSVNLRSLVLSPMFLKEPKPRIKAPPSVETGFTHSSAQRAKEGIASANFSAFKLLRRKMFDGLTQTHLVSPIVGCSATIHKLQEPAIQSRSPPLRQSLCTAAVGEEKLGLPLLGLLSFGPCSCTLRPILVSARSLISHRPRSGRSGSFSIRPMFFQFFWLTRVKAMTRYKRMTGRGRRSPLVFVTPSTQASSNQPSNLRPRTKLQQVSDHHVWATFKHTFRVRAAFLSDLMGLLQPSVSVLEKVPGLMEPLWFSSLLSCWAKVPRYRQGAWTSSFFFSVAGIYLAGPEILSAEFRHLYLHSSGTVLMLLVSQVSFLWERNFSPSSFDRERTVSPRFSMRENCFKCSATIMDIRATNCVRVPLLAIELAFSKVFVVTTKFVTLYLLCLVLFGSCSVLPSDSLTMSFRRDCRVGTFGLS